MQNNESGLLSCLWDHIPLECRPGHLANTLLESIVSSVNQYPITSRVASRVAFCLEEPVDEQFASDVGEKSRTILGEGRF
jgi:hypothetical protein